MSKPLPPDRAGAWPRWGALALLGLWLFLCFTLIPYSHGDEGNSLAEGLRWARDGELIHRDFFEFLPPLSFALAGLLQLGFGPGLLAARLATWAMLLASAWLMAWWARRAGAGPWGATLPALALGALLHPLFPGYSHHWLALALGLGAVGAALQEARWGLALSWPLAGALAAGCGLSVQSDGAALVLALALWAAWLAWARGEGWRGWGRRAAAFALGLGAIALPSLAALAWAGALGPALRLWVLWPLHQYGQAGGMNDARFGFDLVAYLSTWGPWLSRSHWYARAAMALGVVLAGPLLLLLACGWAPRVARRLPAPADEALALAFLLGALHFLLALKGKADLPHLAVYLAPACVALAAAAGRFARRWTGPGEAGLGALPSLLLAAWVLAGAWHQVGLMRLEPWHRPHWAGGPDAWWLAQPAIRALRALPPGMKLAAFPYGGHFYVYGPRPAVRIHMFMPPSARFHRPEEAAEFWASLRRERPAVLFAPYLAGLVPWASYEVEPPPGYREAWRLPSPQYPGMEATLYLPEGARRP